MKPHLIKDGVVVYANDRIAGVTAWVDAGAPLRALGPPEDGKYGFRFPAVNEAGVLVHIEPSKVSTTAPQQA